jgi:uncharacterized protein YraI
MTSIRSSLLLAAFLCSIPAAALAQEAYTNRTANVRAGPDPTYPVVAQLPPAAGLQVMGCIDDYSWCDVVFGDNRGWVYAGSLSYPYQNGRVPILGYGAVIGLPIITFSLGSYWDSYYRGRPWYRNRSYWVSRPPPPHFRPPQRPQPRPGFNRGPEPRRVDRGPAVVTRPARPERPALRAPDNRPSGGAREGARQSGRESRGDGKSEHKDSER